MVKYEKTHLLDKEEQHELLANLCQAISCCKNISHAADLVEDLLTAQEAQMLAKRLKIAQLLIQQAKYREIRDDLKVGLGTIARINTWLEVSGEGFRRVISKIKPISSLPSTLNKNSLKALKRSHGSYFWPQLVVEDIVRNANKRQQQKLWQTLNSLDKKSKVFIDLNRLLKQSGFADQKLP